jgi:CDP-diacylglycerol---glycerol-3-phosphate 3-phosphatidyltransferase
MPRTLNVASDQSSPAPEPNEVRERTSDVSTQEERMFDGRWRSSVDAKTEPVGTWLQHHGITADVLTATGLVTATATAVAAALGYFYVAVVLLTLTGAHDLFDGPVAKAAGTSSVRGAFFDSVTDRVADALLMGGVAWYLVSQGKGHLALLPLAILGVTALVSYERAKAEALGLHARGGLMERAERMILLGVGFLVSALLIPVLWILLVLTSFTAINRFVKVWREATKVSPEAVSARRSADRDSRFREWRERSGFDWNEDSPVVRWRARRAEHVSSRPGRPRRARRTTRLGRHPASRP